MSITGKQVSRTSRIDLRSSTSLAKASPSMMVICSPGDETPVEPCDAKPDEVQIARALEEINAATIFGARSIRSPWAGLRNFAPDGDPVVGWDPQAECFFWYAGRGGYGMHIGPPLWNTGAGLM